MFAKLLDIARNHNWGLLGVVIGIATFILAVAVFPFMAVIRPLLRTVKRNKAIIIGDNGPHSFGVFPAVSPRGYSWKPVVAVSALVALLAFLSISLFPTASAFGDGASEPYRPINVSPEMRFFVGPWGMADGVDRSDACRTFHIFGHQWEQTGETDALACPNTALPVTITATVGVTPTTEITSTPTIEITETSIPTGTPPVPSATPTVIPTMPPITETTVVTPTVEPTQPPTVVAPTETPKPHCDNGAGNGSDCTPGNSSGSNQGQGVPTGDQENQGENGNGGGNGNGNGHNQVFFVLAFIRAIMGLFGINRGRADIILHIPHVDEYPTQINMPRRQK